MTEKHCAKWQKEKRGNRAQLSSLEDIVFVCCGAEKRAI